MFYYSFNELYLLVREYNKKHKTNIDVNSLLGLNEFKIKIKQDFLSLSKKYSPKVIYEDSNYYAVYKPPYWVVNVSEKQNRDSDVRYNMDKNLLQVWLYKNLSYPNKNRFDLGYGISNRLDVNTSGIVLVAKNEPSYRYLRKIINDHVLTQKRYFCLVNGRIEYNGKITVGIKCEEQKFGSNKCFNADEGKHALTDFEILAHLKDKDGNEYTLLNIRIHTGRTHQIRVHMKMLNTYIIGDHVYTKDPVSYERESKLVPRIFLHAYNYNFIDQNKKSIKTYSPLADDLLEALDKNFTSVDNDFNMNDLNYIIRNPQEIQT